MDLVAVAVPLGDDGGAAVDSRAQAVRGEVRAPAAEAHGASHLLRATLGHEEHRLVRVRVRVRFRVRVRVRVRVRPSGMKSIVSIVSIVPQCMHVHAHDTHMHMTC